MRDPRFQAVLAAALSALLMLALAGCGKDAAGTPAGGAETPVRETEKPAAEAIAPAPSAPEETESPVPSAPEDSPEPSAEEQIDVLVENRDVWYEGVSPAYYPGYLYYAVADLNQNGRLEIIRTEYRYDCDVSINRFFELDAAYAKVVELDYDMADAPETMIAPGILNAQTPLMCFAKDGSYYYTIPTPYRQGTDEHPIQVEMMYVLCVDRESRVTTELLGEAWTDVDAGTTSFMDSAAAAIDESSYRLADYIRFPVSEGYALGECTWLWVIPLGDSFRDDLLDSWRSFVIEFT